MTDDEDLTHFAWRDAIEIERWRRTYRAGHYVPDDGIGPNTIDWDDCIELIGSFAGRPGIEKLEWHLDRALKARAGDIDWEKERSDKDFIDELCATLGEDDRMSEEQSKRFDGIEGPSSFLNPFYGWESFPAPGWDD
jgi:hypothetical protein